MHIMCLQIGQFFLAGILLPWMLFSLLNFSLPERTSKCILNVVALFQLATGLQRERLMTGMREKEHKRDAVRESREKCGSVKM